MSAAPSTSAVTPPVRRAAIVGDASLAGQCLELALANGLAVGLVVTADDSVRAVAGEHAIPVVDHSVELATALDEHDIDCLLSIANLRMLPTAALDRVDVAINFHDGPLPAYAGLNVTTWALLHDEPEHAITWHLMTSEVDAGAIVATERFPIAPDDTAFALNARCYEAAIATFPAIVADLVAGELVTTPQPDGPRRVYRRHERPITVIDPTSDPAHTVRAVRALSLGHQAVDTMGSVRLVAGDRLIVVTGARVDSPGGRPTGELRRESGELRLATTGDDLVLTSFEAADGRTLDAAEAQRELGVADGATIPPASRLADGLAELDPVLARNEEFWRRHLPTTTPASPPIASPRDRPAGELSRSLPHGVTSDDIATALVAWCRRLTNAETIAIAVSDPHARSVTAALHPLARVPIVRSDTDLESTFGRLRTAMSATRPAALDRGAYLADLVGRDPARRGTDVEPTVHLALDVDLDASPGDLGPGLTIEVAADLDRWRWRAAADRAELERAADQVEALLVAGLAAPDAPISELPLLGAAEADALDRVNDTSLEYDRTATIDALIDARIALDRDAPAVTAGTETLTYGELGDRVAALAAELATTGVRRGDRVGIALDRRADLVVAVLAVLRVGAAYVPLDPTYPLDRRRLMIVDSGLRTLIGSADQAIDGLDDLTVLDPRSTAVGAVDDVDPADRPRADDLAYVIYTSGSTGTPKGVMLEHRNVVNFFAAMDQVIEHKTPGVWLAVTSLSFDISVLELLWTLARGFHVVLQPELRAGASAPPTPRRDVAMSLFYFAAGEAAAGDGYRLLLDSARWADRNGFEAVWTPERHFHAFGGAYPNPSVTGAALAATTDRIAIRAGSVVAPLHSPVRIAEEWSVVDNLSNGRVGISFAAGWQPNDFVLNPGAYEGARERLPETIATVQRLWRGESVELPGHDGAPIPVTTLPRPVQTELPIWLTSAGSPATFEQAGELGANLLTHLLGQSIDQLAANIARYRAAWERAGHDGVGRVTLMLHTYLDDDGDLARQRAHDPMKGYLRTATGLIKNMASAFPTFARAGADADEAFRSLTDDELDQLLEMAADRYLRTSGLFGTVDEAVATIERCSAAGVDEIACLIDFGVETDAVLGSLPLLRTVLDRLSVAPDEPTAPAPTHDASFAELVRRHRVTHLQCTPSLATMLAADPADRAALGTIHHVMLGGEALSTALAAELRDLLPGRLTNMYGPTETTIWSLVHEIDEPPTGAVPIGRPIANTTALVLDPSGGRLPLGVWGELHLGGDGVARGYLGRDELTAERFVERPGWGRTYATGDLARIRADGIVEFAGRSDDQVKIRGHRIELGEVETVLDGLPAIARSVVVAHPREAGEPTLVAFVIADDRSRFDDATARTAVQDRLPDAYVPSRIIAVDEFPLTPNGKVDRRRLRDGLDGQLTAAAPTPVDLDDDTERLVAETWTEVLGRSVGRDDNFFDIGGNSLSAVSVFRQVSDATGAELALTDVFRYPTIRRFAAHLASRIDRSAEVDAPSAVPSGAERGAMRRRAIARRGS